MCRWVACLHPQLHGRPGQCAVGVGALLSLLDVSAGAALARCAWIRLRWRHGVDAKQHGVRGLGDTSWLKVQTEIETDTMIYRCRVCGQNGWNLRWPLDVYHDGAFVDACFMQPAHCHSVRHMQVTHGGAPPLAHDLDARAVLPGYE